ncbi:MAG: hypothetical protein AAF550_14685 [Myxococcota bacterium]
MFKFRPALVADTWVTAQFEETPESPGLGADASVPPLSLELLSSEQAPPHMSGSEIMQARNQWNWALPVDTSGRK